MQQQQQHTNSLATNYIQHCIQEHMFGSAPNIHYPRKHNHEPLYLGLQSAWFNPNSPCIVMFILIHYKTGFFIPLARKVTGIPTGIP